MLKCKEVWLASIVPGFITLALLGVITQLVGILGSYEIGYLDTKVRSKKACMIYCAIFLAEIWFPLIYIYFYHRFFFGGSTNMSLSYPASIFGVLDYPKVNGVIFPINYCIGCLNFLVNAVVMKVTGGLTGAYIVYMCLFIVNIIIVTKIEEGK